jgi:zinc transport system permease protein
MQEIINILQMPFIQRALIAGIVVGFLGSFYAAFVVQRRMSFLGDGLAHSAFGGIALGLLIGTEPMWIALPATVIVALAITWLKEKTELGSDTAIGIFFAVSMALGIIFLALKKNYSVDAFTYLFGSILMVQAVDLYASIILAIATILISVKYWHRWAYATFDTELAKSDRHNVRFDDYLLSVMIALTIVFSIKLVGIVLIAAYLVIPAAASRLISRTFYSMTVLSIIFGITASVAGLFLSVIFDLPSGAVIILTQAFIFFLALIYSRIRK